MRPEITGQKFLSIAERFGVTVQLAAQYTGLSKSTIYALLASGDLAGREIAGRKIVEVQGPRGLLHLCGEAPAAKRGTIKARLEESASP